MKLITKNIEENLLKYPIGSQDGQGDNAKIIVKFFNPYGIGTWLVTEGEKKSDGDWLFFGCCNLFCWEWGYFTLSELESVRLQDGTQMIERDMYLSEQSVGEYLAATL